MAFSLVTLLVTLQDQTIAEFMRKNVCTIFLLGSLKWNSRLWLVIMTSYSTSVSFIENNHPFKTIEGCINTIYIQCYQSTDLPCRLWKQLTYNNSCTFNLLSFALNIMWLHILTRWFWIICSTLLAALLLHNNENKIHTRRQFQLIIILLACNCPLWHQN